MATSQYFEDSRGGELLTAAAVSVPTTAIGLEIDLGASGWGFDLGRDSPEATAMIVPILSKTRADEAMCPLKCSTSFPIDFEAR
jgi:hypothetical protein